jgi:hypothetical protein
LASPFFVEDEGKEIDAFAGPDEVDTFFVVAKPSSYT